MYLIDVLVENVMEDLNLYHDNFKEVPKEDVKEDVKEDSKKDVNENFNEEQISSKYKRNHEKQEEEKVEIVKPSRRRNENEIQRSIKNILEDDGIKSTYEIVRSKMFKDKCIIIIHFSLKAGVVR